MAPVTAEETVFLKFNHGIGTRTYFTINIITVKWLLNLIFFTNDVMFKNSNHSCRLTYKIRLGSRTLTEDTHGVMSPLGARLNVEALPIITIFSWMLSNTTISETGISPLPVTSLNWRKKRKQVFKNIV